MRGTDGEWLVASNSDGVHGQRKERRRWLQRPGCPVARHCHRPGSLVVGNDGVAEQISSLFDKTQPIS